MPVAALSDAAILYGAQRYFDGLHKKSEWPFRSKFQEEDDKLLFLEFLHNLCLYDHIMLDKRPLGGLEFPAFGELSAFLGAVNGAIGKKAVAFKERDQRSTPYRQAEKIQQGICRIVASYVHGGTAAKIEAVKVPWAYHQPLHHDRESIRKELRSEKLDDRWLPFTLFVWRAIWYGAVARFEAKKNRHAVAYVASPGRIAALEAILNARDIAQFKFPREAVRALSWDLPGSPDAGYDFGYLDFASPFELSALADEVADLTPNNALAYAVRYRSSRSAQEARRDWSDILVEGASTCVVGTTTIQIMRDMNVTGNVSQTVRLRGVPLGGDQ